MSFKFLNDGQDGVQRVSPIDTFIDPVSKIRVSNPSNLIDTDFEYGLQPTKWETVELINNTPAFFSKGGDTTIPDITAITTNAGTREITVTTAFPHNLDVGIPIRISGTKSVTADGSYIINATPTNVSFTYLARGDQAETVSIFDLYTSIITGEFFQGSQISIDAAEGITTDGASPSILTVKTENKHGFGPETPFYFLNLNSTIAQEFEAQNTASVSFDPTNSSTAQTFDGSNTLLQTPIDLSNSATTSTLDNVIASIDAVNSTITVNVNSGDSTNWANLKEGDPLYYAVTAGGGYFQDNPRGVVFIKSVENLITNQQATFQVSQLPNGDAIPTLSNTTGNFRIANQARTFAGNNQDPETQVDITITRGSESTFDAANEETVIAGVQGYSGTTINLLVAQGTVDYYVGAMLLYSTNGTPPTELSNNSTYFVTAFAEGSQAGLYTMSVAALPGESSIDFTTTGSGTQTFKQIGISIDKNIIHVKDSNFQEREMLEYSFPQNGSFNYDSDDKKVFFFVEKAFDAHNYRLNDSSEFFVPIVASGGDNVFDIWDNGRIWTVHEFTTVGTSTFQVVEGETEELEYLVVGGGGNGGHLNITFATVAGGGGGGGGVRQGVLPVEQGSYSVLVGDSAQNSSFGSIISAAGGVGGVVFPNQAALNGGSGGGGASHELSGPWSGGLGNTPATTPSQGNNGGKGWDTTGTGSNERAGGGGGAGAPGQDGTSVKAGNGGDGVVSFINGQTKFYGGGGGGSARSDQPPPVGLGGRGGGGDGASGTFVRAQSGAPNTGGGGGGYTAFNGTETQAGAGFGGSGIVIVRYPITPINEEIVSASGGEINVIALEDN